MTFPQILAAALETAAPARAYPLMTLVKEKDGSFAAYLTFGHSRRSKWTLNDAFSFHGVETASFARMILEGAGFKVTPIRSGLWGCEYIGA